MTVYDTTLSQTTTGEGRHAPDSGDAQEFRTQRFFSPVRTLPKTVHYITAQESKFSSRASVQRFVTIDGIKYVCSAEGD